MKKGLLLNGIDIHGNGPSEDEAEELAFPVLPYSADPSFGRRDDTSMVAEVTLDLSLFQRTVKHGLLHIPFPSSVREPSRSGEGRNLKIEAG
jgi:hypothetical protein